MEYSKISVITKDYQSVKEICKRNGQTFSKVFTLLADYLSQNEKQFFPDQSDKEGRGQSDKEVLTEQDFTEIGKVVSKHINRLIGFIKKQDENITDIRQEIRRSTKQILYKVIPEEEQLYSESHPLFSDYEEVINTLKLMLIKKGIDKTYFNENLEADIQKELGERMLIKYRESTDRITKKHFLSE